jgi:hypothetical protein
MNRARALIVSLAVGLAAIAGVFAVAHTVSLGNQSHASTNAQVARRTAQLDRYEASLRKALAQKPPSLPPLPTTTAATNLQSAAPVRVVYHRPPPIVITTKRTGGEHDGEHESDSEGGGADD